MEAIITLAILIGIFLSLLKNFTSPAVTFLIALVILVALDIVPVSVAFEGFSNENLVIIGSLFVLARALEQTVRVDKIPEKLLGNTNSIRFGLVRMMVPVSASSAFVNNTPIVAMMISPVINWARKKGVSSSKFLIPLSYAAIFGGALTLIGTSTNLVVSGLLLDYGYEPFSFFELTKIGLPLALVGISAIVLLAPRLLPDKVLADIDETEIEKKFTVDAKPSKTIINKSIHSAGLRNLKDVFLAEIIRYNGDMIAPVKPETLIKSGDTLRFSGNAESLPRLTSRKNLSIVEEKHAKQLSSDNAYLETVVGHNKTIAGKTLAETGFRKKYQAAVLAIFRSGEKISGSLGNVRLRPGDTLLLISDSGFQDRWSDRSDFLFIRQISRKKQVNSAINWSFAVVLAIISILIFIGAPLVIIILSAALSTVALKMITTSQARQTIDLDLLIMIAAAIGVAKAVDNSGLANILSSNIIEYFGVFGSIGLLLGVIIATSILTELITNAAAALLVFPIAITTALAAGLDPRIFAIAIAISASLSFISPLGYQTNTMVYSAGGYKFSDFFRLGIILNIVTTITLLLLLSFYFNLF